MPRVATKTANVYTRVDPDTKEQAEKILNKLGIPMSHVIVMFLKQVVIQRGMPFEMKLHPASSVSGGNLTKARFDAEMQLGMNDMVSDRTISADDVESGVKKLIHCN